ncbi:hypothetical protein AgCh_038165 [Apium graveolens]
MNGDYVNSLEEFDTTGMDSVWLAIKIPRKMNDDSRTKLSKMEAARDEVVPISRCRLMRSLREENVDLPYDMMKLESARKCNSDARQIGAYERIDMQPDVTYMKQPGRVID